MAAQGTRKWLVAVAAWLAVLPVAAQITAAPQALPANGSNPFPLTQTDPGWAALAGPTVPGGAVDALAVAPSNPDTLYGLLQGPDGERLYRSDDAAVSWQAVYTFTATVSQLAVDPGVTGTVYAGASDGLYRSTNAGLYWTQVYTLGQQIVVVSPSLIYVGGPIGPGVDGCIFGFSQIGIARSVDGGATWQVHGVGCGASVTGLAVAPGQPDIVYAGVHDSETVHRSNDGGQTWQTLLTTADVGAELQSLLLDPLDPTRLYGLDSYGVVVSADSGQHWQRTLNLGCCGSRLAASGGKVFATPGANTLPTTYVYRSEDGGQTWWASVEQLPAGPTALAVDPIHADRLYGGLWQHGVFRSTTGGATWSEADNGIASPAPIAALAAAKEGAVIYAAVNKPRGGLYRTTNGGTAWTIAFTLTAPVAVVVDPTNGDRAFAADGTYAYETHDGQTWTEIIVDFLTAVQVDAVALPAGDLEQPYFGGVTGTKVNSQGAVVRRDPSQVVWPLHTISNTYNIFALAIDPLNPATLYAGSEVTLKHNGFFRSDDYGVTWQRKDNAGPDLGYRAVAVDPTQTNIVYAAALDEQGIIRSTDRGDHWQTISNGLPLSNVSAYALAVDELGTPYAATITGIYRFEAAQRQWVPFGLQGRMVSSLVIEHGAPEILLAGTDMGVWKLNLPRWQVWLPVVTR